MSLRSREVSQAEVKITMSAMTIGKKFLLAIGGLCTALVVVGLMAVNGMANLNKITELITSDPLPGMAAIDAVRGAVLTIRGDVWRHLASPDAPVKGRLDEEIKGKAAEVKAKLEEYDKTITTEEDRMIFEKIKVAWPKYAEAYAAVLDLSRNNKSDEAEAWYNGEVAPLFDTVRDLLASQAELNERFGERLAALSRHKYGRMLWTLWFVIGLCAAGASGFAFATVRDINRSLRCLVVELSDGAAHVASAASQVSGSSQALADDSCEQAASLEETAASSEEISSMARKNSENSLRAAGLVTSSQGKFDETNRLLEQTVAAMSEIDEQSARISRIIKTIDEIAFQTNILALNAAVEAARAGEAGLGFAVVAEEVRSLAQRSAQAAKDTAVLIAESISKSTNGKSQVDRVAAAIHSITDDATRVKAFVDDVNSSSQEQSRGIEQIGQAIVAMQNVTQRSASNAEEGAAAAARLDAQATTLNGIVQRLGEMVGGVAATRRTLTGFPVHAIGGVTDRQARRVSVGHRLTIRRFPATTMAFGMRFQ